MKTIFKISDQHTGLLRWMGIILLVYFILIAVGTIGSGFKWVTGGSEGAASLFSFAVNPFMGLIVGILTTALVQSSSTVSSIIVGLVAGGLPVSMAIPMVMGANIGTSITNTLVSLGHAREKEEFKRAFSTATVHDFFNLLAVIIFFPLELSFKFLEKLSGFFVSFFQGGGTSLSLSHLDFIKPITEPLIVALKSTLSSLPEPFGPITMIIIGILTIFAAITFMGRLLKSVMIGRAKDILHSAIGKGPLSGIASGTAVTILVQSSSTTTSLAVPLAGSGLFTTRDLYPFTLGANIGTCVTALLSATAISGPAGAFALQIALVHLLYNTLAVILIYSVPFLRNIPVICSEWLARLASERKILAIFYIIFTFFIIPCSLIGVSSLP